MYEGLIVVLILFAAFFPAQWPLFKRMTRKDWLLTAPLLLASLYLSVLFIWWREGPSLTDLIRLFYGPPARMIESYFK